MGCLLPHKDQLATHHSFYSTVSGKPAGLRCCHAVLLRYGKVDGDYDDVGHSCFELKTRGRRGQGGGGVG